MDWDDALSIQDAAERLGRSAQAVRQMASAGELEGVKRGNVWWLDARAVERRRREPPGRGRRLSPAMAWSVLLLASGDPKRARRVVPGPHQPSRAKSWLRDHAIVDNVSRLQARASRELFDAHSSELARILRRDDVMRTGLSAAEDVGLHGGSRVAEFYAPASARDKVIQEHSLDARPGPVLARWVPDDVWIGVAGERAPRAALLVDLLEQDDPRARREAARALAAL